MSAAKRTKKSAIGPLGDLAVWAFGQGRTLAAALLVLGAFLMAWWWVWQRVGPRVTRAERYLVELDDVHVTPQPEWVQTDVRAEVYHWLRRGGPMNLLDDDLNPRIAEGFARHPWVERVNRVARLPAGAVQVDLEYRRPVCVVKIGQRLLPVDRSGVLLPAAGVRRTDLEGYPRLVGVDASGFEVEGEPWGSVAVAGGAALAALLSDVWEAWHLKQIVPFPVVGPDGREQLHYHLFTSGGTRIAWGLPPGLDGPGEPTPEEKLARLKAYRAGQGTFDGPAGPLDLDVRAMSRCGQ